MPARDAVTLDAGMPRGHTHLGEQGFVELPMGLAVTVWQRAVRGVIAHGFALRFAPLEKPKTGTFDGIEIVLSPDTPFQLQIFLLLHLFGHSVQWVAPSLADSIVGFQQCTNLDEFLTHLQAYENEAAQLGLQLLHDEGIREVDDWFSGCAATDWNYVHTFYTTGKIPQWSDCVSTFPQPLVPMPIPRLQHRKVNVRFAF